MADFFYVFINDLSFQEQFNQDDLAKGLLEFLRLLSRFRDLGSEKYSILYYGSMYNKNISHGISYAAAFRFIKGEDKDVIFQLLNNMDKKRWQKIEDPAPLHDASETYSVGNIDVSSSSLAEAYEYENHKSNTEEVVVINMPKSSFGKLIKVKKTSTNITLELVALDCQENAMSFFQSNGLTLRYNTQSTKRPLPEQTILSNTQFFSKTTRRNKSEYLYERIGYNELWCLDDLHYDGSAHFEIFSKADDTWKGECRDLQEIKPDYQSKKHKGSKILG